MGETASPMSARLAATGEVVAHLDLLTKLGPTWFQKGRSRKDALRTQVDLRSLGGDAKPFRRVPLIEGAMYLALDVWNGRPSRESATFSLSLNDPPVDPDRLVVDVELGVLEQTADWPDLLRVARELSHRLGGCVVLASHEVLAWAEKHGVKNADCAAYAAFWGPDRSQHNPLYRFLASEGRAAPFELLACESWEQVAAPEEARVAEIAGLIARASAAAGATLRP